MHKPAPSARPAAETSPDSQPTLLRGLGPSSAVALVVGGVIGSGIFLKPGKIAADGGDFKLIICGWIAGGVICYLGGLCFAELGAMFPRSGGLYVYLREAYGKTIAFMFGWTEFLFAKPGSIGALSMAFAGAVMALLPSSWDGMAIRVSLGLVVIAVLATVNCLGVVWGGMVQSFTTWIKAGSVALVAIAPFAVHLFTGTTVNSANYGTRYVKPATAAAAAASDARTHAAARAENGASQAHITAAPKATAGKAVEWSGAAQSWASIAAKFGLIFLAIMWAYNGWHDVTPVAEEIRDPERNMPRSLFLGIAIVSVLYVSVNLAYHGVLSMEELARAGEDGAKLTAERVAGPAGVTLISAIIMCSTLGAISTNMLIGPRVSFAMGRDGVFFAPLGRVHSVFRTPAVAIITQAVMAMGLIVVSAVLKLLLAEADLAAISNATLRKIVQTLKEESVFTLLTNFVIFASSIFYALCVLAVFVLRRRQAQRERPYRTWGYPWTPLAFLAFYAWFLYRVYCDQPFESYAGLVLIALGLPVFWAFARKGRAAC